AGGVPGYSSRPNSGGEAEGGECHQHRAGQHDPPIPAAPRPAVFFAPTPAASDISPVRTPGGIGALGGEHRPVGGELGAAVGAGLGALSGHRGANGGLLGALGGLCRAVSGDLGVAGGGGLGGHGSSYPRPRVYRRIDPDARSNSALLIIRPTIPLAVPIAQNLGSVVAIH